jgi:hypothetical protein
MKKLFYLILISFPIIISSSTIDLPPISIPQEQEEIKLSYLKDITEINDSIIDIIAYIESRFNTNAKGDYKDGTYRAYGILQMWNIAVKDHNRLFKTNYTHKDAFDKDKSYLMCRNLLNYGIKRYYNICGEYPTIIEVLRMWNANIYGGWNKSYSIKYVRKYAELQKEIEEYLEI